MTNQQIAAQILGSLNKVASKIGALEESQRNDRRELNSLRESMAVLFEKVGSLAEMGYQVDSGALKIKDIENALEDLSEEVEKLASDLDYKNVDISRLKFSLQELDRKLQIFREQISKNYISRAQIKDWILQNLWAVILFLVASVFVPYLIESFLVK